MNDIFLGYETSAAYWRSAAVDTVASRPARVSWGDVRDRYASSQALRSARFRQEDLLACMETPGLGSLTPPVGLVVPTVSARVQSDATDCHVWRTPLPDGCFVRLDRDIVGEATYVSGPEFTFVQMASRLSYAQLVLMGFELCGTYVADAAAPRGFRDREPLTSIKRLAAFAERLGSVRGIRMARRAIRAIEDGAASPMEGVSAATLRAPKPEGGYGLPRAELNYRIELNAEQSRILGASHFVCDLYWPEHKLAVEYDSDAFHTGPERIARDSERRAALAYLGITVVTVTRAQLASVAKMDRVALVLEQHLGIRHREVQDGRTRRLRLRRALLLAARG